MEYDGRLRDTAMEENIKGEDDDPVSLSCSPFSSLRIRGGFFLFFFFFLLPSRPILSEPASVSADTPIRTGYRPVRMRFLRHTAISVRIRIGGSKFRYEPADTVRIGRYLKVCNALHTVGNFGSQQQLSLQANVAGAALQMQRELQWFKAVEKLLLPPRRYQKNLEDKTPQDVFTVTHKELVEKGEKWMKDTASSCTIVAALIVTVVFAAAITVPGGINGNGLPIFLEDGVFFLFGMFDALALFSSTASLLMFLSIFTSRYGEQDFLYSLPRKLIIGLVTLFLSIISIMIAFGATLKIVFGHKRAWVVIPVVVLSSVPITLFALLQFPLLLDIIRSTYYPGIFRKRSNRILY